MDWEAANWLCAVIERERERTNERSHLFVRKSSNDIQLGKVATEHDFHPLVCALAFVVFSFFCALRLVIIITGAIIVPSVPVASKVPPISRIAYQLTSIDNSNVKWESESNKCQCSAFRLIILGFNVAQRAPFQLLSMLSTLAAELSTRRSAKMGKWKHVTWRHFNFLYHYMLPLALSLYPNDDAETGFSQFAH